MRESPELVHITDPEIIKLVLKLKKLSEKWFLFACSMFVKIHVLVEYISTNNKDVIQQVKLGKADKVKRYVEVLLLTSKTFQNDIRIHQEILAMELRPCIDETKQKVWTTLRSLRWWQRQCLKTLKTVIKQVESVTDRIETFIMRLDQEIQCDIDHNFSDIKFDGISSSRMSTILESMAFISGHILEWTCFVKNDLYNDVLPQLWLCSHCSQWNIKTVTTCTHCDEPIISRTRDRQNLHRAMKEGHVNYTVSTAVVQGEARAGKTSLKCLLLSQSYEKLSTSCIEAPQVAINRYGRTEKCWSLVEDEEMNDRVIAELKTISKTQDEQPLTERRDEAAITSALLQLQDHFNKKVWSVKGSGCSSSQSGSRISISFHQEKEAIATVWAVPNYFYEKCQRNYSIEGLSLHREWLYFIDSGGQIQFQRLLPAFMPFASVLIFVLNLAKSLSDPASTAMQLEHDQQISVSEHSLTVEEILKQLLSAIASSRSTELYKSIFANDFGSSSFVKPPSEKLNVIAVATHRDKYDQLVKEGKEIESIQKKEVKLNQIFSFVDSTCEILRNAEPHLNILHEIDGSKAERGEFDDPVVEQIAEKLKGQAYEIEVPIRWHCFGVLLRQKAKQGCGVLSVSSCQKLGKQVEMSPDEVVSALTFFHIFNMLLYYPDTPVADMVFVCLDSLIDIIKELTVTACSHDSWTSPGDIAELVAEGTLSVGVLKRSKKFMEVSQAFGNFEKKLLGLFEYLLIAVALPEKSSFFMPALLPVKAVSDANPFPNTIPLLFFSENAVPMGLFCAVIVYLLSLKEDNVESSIASKVNTWWINHNRNYSNYMNLSSTNSVNVVLIEHFNRIEVYVKDIGSQVEVRDAIANAIKETMKKRNLQERPRKAFYCPCGEIKSKHVAIVKKKGQHKYNVICWERKDIINGKVPQHYWSWFKDQMALENPSLNEPPALAESTGRVKSHPSTLPAVFSSAVALASAKNPLLNERPPLDELNEHVNIGIAWRQLGIQLRLELRELDCIDQQYGLVADKLSHMYQLWLDRNPTANRSDVLEALRKIDQATIASKWMSNM